MPERVPPCRAGDRVRCLVSTAQELRGIELFGRVGTVERCARFGPTRDGGRAVWVAWVRWDGLVPRMLVHHDPEELAPAEA
jgi:hypothetical protein